MKTHINKYKRQVLKLNFYSKLAWNLFPIDCAIKGEEDNPEFTFWLLAFGFWLLAFLSLYIYIYMCIYIYMFVWNFHFYKDGAFRILLLESPHITSVLGNLSVFICIKEMPWLWGHTFIVLWCTIRSTTFYLFIYFVSLLMGRDEDTIVFLKKKTKTKTKTSTSMSWWIQICESFCFFFLLFTSSWKLCLHLCILWSKFHWTKYKP